ncbi:MAG: hypothetical protein V8S14_06505 [Lachnospiraceae bacterium]
MPRFYDVTEGKITIDGMDIRKLRSMSCGPAWICAAERNSVLR